MGGLILFDVEEFKINALNSMRKFNRYEIERGQIKFSNELIKMFRDGEITSGEYLELIEFVDRTALLYLQLFKAKYKS